MLLGGAIGNPTLSKDPVFSGALSLVKIWHPAFLCNEIDFLGRWLAAIDPNFTGKWEGVLSAVNDRGMRKRALYFGGIKINKGVLFIRMMINFVARVLMLEWGAEDNDAHVCQSRHSRDVVAFRFSCISIRNCSLKLQWSTLQRKFCRLSALEFSPVRQGYFVQ